MTIKELRILKGLNQTQAANILHISLRSYQNYENKEDLIGSDKYRIYFNILHAYKENTLSDSSSDNNYSFSTNIITGESLKRLISDSTKYNKRYCYSKLKDYLNHPYKGKVCVLYGLRRTGKTTLLFQSINELNVNECAYIKIQKTDTMSCLLKDINLLLELGIKYLFIDEITLLENFINTSSILSDVYSMMGLKIVLSGTDSLGFIMTSRDELYDRIITIHTTYISFKEYSSLIFLNSIDSYIEYGGTLKMENMNYDDKDYSNEEVSFKDDESSRKYIDTAISKNILHTLKNDTFGSYFNELKDLYENNELVNVINRIVQNINHNFVLKVIEDKFKSQDLGSTKNLLLKDVPNSKAYILDNINENDVISRLKNIIDVKEKEELKVSITQDHINKINKYLMMLDLIVNIPDISENGTYLSHNIFTQPGMRYSIAKALVYSLLQDAYFKNINEEDKLYVINKILEDVKGRMQEDIVLLETYVSLPQNKYQVFKFKFDIGGEIDMVIYDKKNHSCSLYEIKHSKNCDKNQYKYLTNKGFNNIIESRYGKITSRNVIYRGQDTTFEGIKYLNVEEYLKNLK